MPYTYAAGWRQRNNAIRRKGAYEADLLLDGDEGDQIELPPQSLKSVKAKDVQVDDQLSKPSSPVSVASTLGVPGELKSLILPGAWVTVGKGGKPLRNGKMYDAPVNELTKKKKKRTRRKADTLSELEPLVLTLEEVASSSKCLESLEHSSAQRRKQMMRSKDAKHWAGYNRAKLLKREALDALIAVLEDPSQDSLSKPPPTATKPRKDNKANQQKDKSRRNARSTAAAVRCLLQDADEQEAFVPATIEREMARETQGSRKAQLSWKIGLVAGDKSLMEVEPPGAWTTVGKRGKNVSNFPPLQARNKEGSPSKRQAEHAEDSGVKHRKPMEQATQKLSDNHGKTKKACLVM
jgi:hypothetical protein